MDITNQSSVWGGVFWTHKYIMTRGKIGFATHQTDQTANERELQDARHGVSVYTKQSQIRYRYFQGQALDHIL
jgi:hypothetical protein